MRRNKVAVLSMKKSLKKKNTMKNNQIFNRNNQPEMRTKSISRAQVEIKKKMSHWNLEETQTRSLGAVKENLKIKK